MFQNNRCQFWMNNPHEALLSFGTENDGRMKIIHAHMRLIKKNFSAVSRTICQFYTCTGDTAGSQIFEPDLVHVSTFLEEIEKGVCRFQNMSFQKCVRFLNSGFFRLLLLLI